MGVGLIVIFLFQVCSVIRYNDEARASLTLLLTSLMNAWNSTSASGTDLTWCYSTELLLLCLLSYADCLRARCNLWETGEGSQRTSDTGGCRWPYWNR